MIGTLVRIAWTNLKRDRVAQLMSFALPIVFFSIFATVFGNQSNGTARIRVAVVDEDRSEFSQRIVQALTGEKSLRVRTTAGADGGAPLDRATAEKLVREGEVPVAVVLPRGVRQGGSHSQLLADVSDRIAPAMVSGLLQRAYAAAMFGPAVIGNPAAPVDTVDVMRNGTQESLISFYAAGIGVMFLLFSVSGASGALLDEVDSGTLDRVLSTRVGMSGLLAGKWVYITLLGMLQLSVMFLWGRLAFRLDLFHHLPGFIVMTLFTSMAAAGFGLLLATIARTRAQLSGMGTIIILTMSSLGGSMFPRFLMSGTMQKLGLVTFNAWALDGYLKVFWRNAAITALWPQLLVLSLLTIGFLSFARMFARRWEAA